MNEKEQVRQAYDLPQYIQANGVTLKKTGNVHVGVCPFHSDSTPSFTVYPDGWHCFGCGESGDLFGFAMKKFNLTFPEALAKLAEDKGIALTPSAPRPNASYEKRLFEIVQVVEDTYHNYLLSDNEDAIMALAYLTLQRGLTLATILAFKLGYAPKGGKRIGSYLNKKGFTGEEMRDTGIISENDYDIFTDRIIFPIHDNHKRPVGFGGRTLGNDPRKYINSPSSMVFNKSNHLFGIDLAIEAIRKSKVATIVEGYLDAVQAHQAGYYNVVAQMGTAITENQLKTLKASANTIVFALDNDTAGQSATTRGITLATDVLKQDYSNRLGISLKVASLDGKDPDEFIRAAPLEFGKRISGSMTVAKYLIEINRAQLGMGADVETRTAKAMELIPLLTVTENDVAKNLNLQMLANELNVPLEILVKTPKHRVNSKKGVKQDKTPINPNFQKIEAQILATILESENGLGMYFRLSGELMAMAWGDAIKADDITLANDDLGYGFYPLSESDFMDSQHRALWHQFQPNLETSDIQDGGLLAQLMTVKPLTFDQLLVAVVSIRKRFCQLAIETEQEGEWNEAKMRLIEGLANVS